MIAIGHINSSLPQCFPNRLLFDLKHCAIRPIHFGWVTAPQLDWGPEDWVPFVATISLQLIFG